MSKDEPKELRRGWTTGACATAAAKAAYEAQLTGAFPDPVEISLPKNGTAGFALTRHGISGAEASATITKDAGDDPDVTHGALVTSTVRLAAEGSKTPRSRSGGEKLPVLPGGNADECD